MYSTWPSDVSTIVDRAAAFSIAIIPSARSRPLPRGQSEIGSPTQQLLIWPPCPLMVSAVPEKTAVMTFAAACIANAQQCLGFPES
jgi:hypothetical protein